MAITKPVIIAGAGPVGCVAALRLVQAGIPIILLEGAAELPRTLRASTFHPPTVDMMDELGITAELEAQGLICRYYQYRDRRTGEIAEFDLDVLRERLNAIREANPQIRVYVKGDSQVPYGRMMEVMDRYQVRGSVSLNVGVCDHYPEIIEASDEDASYEEGCLSLPEHYSDVVRPASVKVRYLDRDGKQQEMVQVAAAFGAATLTPRPRMVLSAGPPRSRITAMLSPQPGPKVEAASAHIARAAGGMRSLAGVVMGRAAIQQNPGPELGPCATHPVCR